MELQTTNGQTNMQTIHSHNNLPALTKEQKALANEARALTLAGNPSFPIPNIMLAEYAIVISEEAPGLTPAILKKMCRMMMTGKLPYNPNDGIRNIFEGFTEYLKHRASIDIFNVNTGEAAKTHEDNNNEKADKSEWFVYDDYQLNGRSGKIALGERWGFKAIAWEDVRARGRYLKRCSEKNIKPLSYTEWLAEEEQKSLQAQDDAQKAEIIDYADEDLDF